MGNQTVGAALGRTPSTGIHTRTIVIERRRVLALFYAARVSDSLCVFHKTADRNNVFMAPLNSCPSNPNLIRLIRVRISDIIFE